MSDAGSWIAIPDSNQILIGITGIMINKLCNCAGTIRKTDSDKTSVRFAVLPYFDAIKQNKMDKISMTRLLLYPKD
jgi:hypothetical protein